MKKFFALLIALIVGLFSVSVGADVTVNSIDTPNETKIVEWEIGYGKRCRSYRGNIQPHNWKPIKWFIRRVALAPLMLLTGISTEGSKLDGVSVINNGNPVDIGEEEGFFFTVSPSTAKKRRAYRTDKPVPLTEHEKKMPGVVVAQNRGMLFSSCHAVSGDFVIPNFEDLNLIVVPEASRKLKPVGDEENKIAWKGKGDHEIKDVISDGQGQHWFCKEDGKLATDLWFKLALYGYGIKGMVQPGLATDVGAKIIDYWNVERTITLGNTMLVNSSLVKGINAYGSREELIAHSKEWGLTTLMQQWQSGNHKVDKKRQMGTQAVSTNFELTEAEISELLKPEARKIWAMQFEKIAWMKMANANTSRGRAFIARPDLVYKDLIINQINTKAGTNFRRIAQGKFMAEGQYLKMYQDKLAYSYVYIHGMNINEAAKKAAKTGLHGEIRVSPYFAGRKFVKGKDGKTTVEYEKETFLDNKGRFILVALVRYPHGAPSETIIVKAYIDETVPKDVIIFPVPVANEDGTINVKYLYALRLQGADFDGDAVTAYTEKVWLEAQKRNTGKPYMIIPINTEGTEKDKTLVTDETWEDFCRMKVEGLSNRVGLIATSLKYFLSQKAKMIRLGLSPEMIEYMIVEHACAMGDDIDEFKHGKATNDLALFTVLDDGKEETLYSPYFNRYAMKYKDEESLDKACFFMDKCGNVNGVKKPGEGVLDMFAVAAERLMEKCGIKIVRAKEEAADGTDRFFFTVNPAQWAAKEVDLFTAEHGTRCKPTTLPEQLEKTYGVEHGTAFTAKSLFEMLYRDHAATCKTLMANYNSDDVDSKDAAIKAIEKISEKYALAKIAIVAWTKKMAIENDHENISAADAMRTFTTIMVQHVGTNRSTLENMTRIGVFKKKDGSEYKKTTFAAQRLLNYFLDVCGDGLLLLPDKNVELPNVSELFIKAAEVEVPDKDEAIANALKELASIDKIVDLMPNGMNEVYENITNEELYEILDDGSIDLGIDIDGEWQ